MTGSHSEPFSKFVLARYPNGLPVPDDFELVTGVAPIPGPGHVLVEHSHFGLAPAARVRMTPNLPGYSKGMSLGDTIYSAAAGRVVASANDSLPVGTVVASVDGGWQTHQLSDGSNLTAIDESIAPRSVWLGVLGISGFTGYVGLDEIARPQPGETLVVSAAAGAVGSFVAQMAGLRECRVVGIAGSDAKCRHVEEAFGVACCVNYRAPEFIDTLAAACPDGVDIFFDNVGGQVRDGVFPLMSSYGRIVVCGQISQYSATAAQPGPDWYPIMVKRLMIRGLYFGDFLYRTHDFQTEVSAWLRDGSLAISEHVVTGFRATPDAFIGMLEGRYSGKVIVKL